LKSDEGIQDELKPRIPVNTVSGKDQRIPLKRRAEAAFCPLFLQKRRAEKNMCMQENGKD
jgi:hypothetical protein